MKRFYLLIFLALAMFILPLSCTEKQDFDQYDDLSITPTFESSILYVEVPERTINSVTGINFITQNFNFDAFSSSVFADRVIGGVITYELENTTSKEAEVTIEFLDEADNVLDTEILPVQPAPTAIERREIFYGIGGRSLDVIINTSSIRLSALNLGDNTSTSNLPDPTIKLRSSAKFRLRIK